MKADESLDAHVKSNGSRGFPRASTPVRSRLDAVSRGHHAIGTNFVLLSAGPFTRPLRGQRQRNRAVRHFRPDLAAHAAMQADKAIALHGPQCARQIGGLASRAFCERYSPSLCWRPDHKFHKARPRPSSLIRKSWMRTSSSAASGRHSCLV